MDNELEIWKDLIDYEGLYKISNLGNIKSCNKRYSHKPIYKKITKKGYNIVALSKNKIIKSYNLHRLVAINFIENPNLKNQINHINGIKTDNRVDNLEWVTAKENIKHAFHLGLMDSRIKNMKKPVIDISNGEIYDSIYQASRILELPYTYISKRLQGITKNNTSLKYL